MHPWIVLVLWSRQSTAFFFVDSNPCTRYPPVASSTSRLAPRPTIIADMLAPRIIDRHP